MGREIRIAGSTGDLDPLPLFTLFFCCSQWFLYGGVGLLLTGNDAMINLVYANVGGACLGACYVYSFYHFCEDTDKRRNIIEMLRMGGCLIIMEVFLLVFFAANLALRILEGSAHVCPLQ